MSENKLIHSKIKAFNTRLILLNVNWLCYYYVAQKVCQFKNNNKLWYALYMQKLYRQFLDLLTIIDKLSQY